MGLKKARYGSKKFKNVQKGSRMLKKAHKGSRRFKTALEIQRRTKKVQEGSLIFKNIKGERIPKGLKVMVNN